MSKEIIKVGKYSFAITEDIIKYGNRIISHTFKIGGRYDNCIGISYTYRGEEPVDAKISFVEYEPECSLNVDLEKNGGTVLMLKTLLRYVYRKIPSISKFKLDDMSHIDCSVSDLSKPPPRKIVEPLNLAYLSIAYNSSTWYEKNFGAVMNDAELYERYKSKLAFLSSESDKPDFMTFIQMAKPPNKQIEYLQKIYESTKTYRDFFKAIPFKDRCEILGPWLNNFMEYYLSSVFKNSCWIIDIKNKEMNITTGGSKSKTRKQNDYSSKYKIVMFKKIHKMG